MLRNDLITRLSDHDNDTVVVRIGGILVDIESVSDDVGGIVLVLNPDDLQVAFELGVRSAPTQ